MSPSELKEAIRGTFHLKMNPSQLGAMAHLFGTGAAAGEEDSEEGNTTLYYKYIRNSESLLAATQL